MISVEKYIDQNHGLEKSDIFERLDRELLVNTYWQSNALLLIKRANKFFPLPHVARRQTATSHHHRPRQKEKKSPQQRQHDIAPSSKARAIPRQS